MRKGSIRELWKIKRRAAKLSRVFPKITHIRHLRNLVFDALPIEFHYYRTRRLIRLVIGIEIERLLGISMKRDLREEIFVLCEISVDLEGRNSENIRFRESFSFLNGDDGQELQIKKIVPGPMTRYLERKGLWIPVRGYCIHFTHLEFLCIVRRLKDIRTRLIRKKGFPEIILVKQRRSGRSSGKRQPFMSILDSRLEGECGMR